MSKQDEIRKELEEQDAIGLTILLNSKSKLNQTAINIIQATRRCEKLVIDAQQLLKQLYIESEFMIQNLSDYQRQKLDFQIVNNIKDGKQDQHGKEKERGRI